MTTLVLASSSPRRRDLLDALGLRYTVEPPHVDETQHEHESPLDFVRRVSTDKALAIHRPGTATLAADTIVVLGGAVLGKPTSIEDAVATLMILRGRSHVVHTGVALATDEGVHTTISSTTVTIADLSNEQIAWYVSTGEPMDKAGSYAMQGIGGTFVDHIDGDPFNVIGLPLAPTRALFAEAGLDLLSFR